MRIPGTLLGLLVSVLLAGGCDTDQPLQLDAQNATITFSAEGTGVPLFEVFDVYLDDDFDGIPDDYNNDSVPDVDVACVPSGTGSAVTPWPFSFRVRVIRDGEVQPIELTSELANELVGNLSPYDTTEGTPGTAPFNFPLSHPKGNCLSSVGSLSPVSCNPDNAAPGTTDNMCTRLGVGLFCLPSGECTANPAKACFSTADCGTDGPCILPAPDVNRNLVFENPRVLSGVNRDVLTSTRNIVDDLFAGTGLLGPLEETVCPGADIGPAILDGVDQPGFDFLLQPGDTVTVEARPGDIPPVGLPITGNPVLSATLTVDGESVQVEGDSSAVPGEGISFFYQSR